MNIFIAIYVLCANMAEQTQQSRPTRTITGITNYVNYINIRAFSSGVFLVFSFILISIFMSRNVDSVAHLGPYKLVLGILFIGLSSGYYIGKAIDHGSRPVDSFLIGFFVSLAIIVLLIYRIGMASGILISISVTVFLMYNSGMIESHEEIERWIGVLTSISLYGLVALALIHYVAPVAVIAYNNVLQWIIAEPIRGLIIALLTILVLVMIQHWIGFDAIYERLDRFIRPRANRFVEP